MSAHTVDFIRQQFKDARTWIDSTMEGVDNQLANERINPKSMTIGAQYVHLIGGFDGLVHGMFFDNAPLSAGEWATKTGATPIHPDTGTEEWSKVVKVDIEMAKKYADAVFTSVDKALAELKDEDLDKEIDMSSWGMGVRPRSSVLSAAVMNALAHTGEISNMKGLKGLVGYGF